MESGVVLHAYTHHYVFPKLVLSRCILVLVSSKIHHLYRLEKKNCSIYESE